MEMPTKEKVQAVTAELRALINENNVLNSLLELLASQHARVESLEREVSKLRARMHVRDVLLPEARQRYAGRTTITVDAGLPLRKDQGLYELEYDQLGHPYRWAGPERSFHFDLHLDRTVPLELRIRLGKHPIGTGEGLRCFSDDVELPLVRGPSIAFVEFTAVLLPREILGATRLNFVAAQSFVPKLAEGEAGDSRTLCVLFYELKVAPAAEGADLRYLHAVAPALEKRPTVATPQPAAAIKVAAAAEAAPVKAAEPAPVTRILPASSKKVAKRAGR